MSEENKEPVVQGKLLEFPKSFSELGHLRVRGKRKESSTVPVNGSIPQADRDSI